MYRMQAQENGKQLHTWHTTVDCSCWHVPGSSSGGRLGSNTSILFKSSAGSQASPLSVCLTVRLPLLHAMLSLLLLLCCRSANMDTRWGHSRGFGGGGGGGGGGGRAGQEEGCAEYIVLSWHKDIQHTLACVKLSSVRAHTHISIKGWHLHIGLVCLAIMASGHCTHFGAPLLAACHGIDWPCVQHASQLNAYHSSSIMHGAAACLTELCAAALSVLQTT